MKRYYSEGGVLKDVLEEDGHLSKKFGCLLQMGEQDRWTVIDLRSFVEAFSYAPQKFLINEAVSDLSKRYDLIVIPKTEELPTLNVKS